MRHWVMISNCRKTQREYRKAKRGRTIAETKQYYNGLLWAEFDFSQVDRLSQDLVKIDEIIFRLYLAVLQ